jgi:hypothetical protein
MDPYLANCLGRIAPYYNLVLVLIVAILFMKLFAQQSKKIYLIPWKILFFAVIVYVIEEVLTVAAGLEIIPVSSLILVNPILEMIIITAFIYVILLQREYVLK